MYQWDYAAPTGFALASGLRREDDVGFSEAGRGLSGALSVIHWSLEDRVATVWLHRPHRHNASTGTMHAEYRQVMAELEHGDDVRAIVVTGTPPAFCVGGDSQALEGHGRRCGYDSALPPEPWPPPTSVRLIL